MRYKTYGKGERIEKFPEIKSEMSKFKWNEKRAYDKTERAKKKNTAWFRVFDHRISMSRYEINVSIEAKKNWMKRGSKTNNTAESSLSHTSLRSWNKPKTVASITVSTEM